MDFEARHIAALCFLRKDRDRDCRDAPVPADEDAFRDLRTWKLAKDDGVGILHRLTVAGAGAVQGFLAHNAAHPEATDPAAAFALSQRSTVNRLAQPGRPIR
ncbi:hypothetical protein [Azospirillum soli]|uniref:hypothetical protein n=1 Tax=Azospirillum soli TaxID=1304799 RepID=UPI001AE2DF09|nr:hypothetical protein [Azospirillum soli]MBP2312623.1 hypothetical protein [Azospirillum soli]